VKAPVRHGGRVLVDQLRRHGVDTVFTVPGESFLAVLDALHDEPGIRTVVCRHESGAGIMAEAQARLRGDLGVAFVTRGPGATHASVAVHNASMSGAALLLFIGQVPTAHRGRRAFQEVGAEGSRCGPVEPITALDHERRPRPEWELEDGAGEHEGPNEHQTGDYRALAKSASQAIEPREASREPEDECHRETKRPADNAEPGACRGIASRPGVLLVVEHPGELGWHSGAERARAKHGRNSA